MCTHSSSVCVGFPYTHVMKECYLSVCKTSNVWTRKRCRTDGGRILSWLFGCHKQASEEEQVVRCESSSSDERMRPVAVQHRIPAERDRRHKEMEETIAKIETELTAG